MSRKKLKVRTGVPSGFSIPDAAFKAFEVHYALHHGGRVGSVDALLHWALIQGFKAVCNDLVGEGICCGTDAEEAL